MKTETFEQFKAWMKNNVPPAGHTYQVQTADRYGWVNKDANDFVNIYGFEWRFADFVRVYEHDENGKSVGEVAYFANNGKTPYSDEIEDEDDY